MIGKRTTALILIMTSACFHAADRSEGYGTAAPREPQDVSEVPVHGFRTRIKLEDGERLVGELLVAELDGVVTIRTRNDGDQTRDFKAIERATVHVDRKEKSWLGGLGGGTLALLPVTAIAGFHAIIIAPIVAAGGIIALGIAAAESRVILKGDELQYLYQYARWPQGTLQQNTEYPALGASD
jgi:hypothetical protein